VGLAKGGALDPTAFLSVQLHNTKDYMLYESFDRFFTHRYVNQTDTPIMFEQSLPVGELSANADQMALNMATRVYSVFNWIPAEAAIRTLIEDQKSLLKGDYSRCLLKPRLQVLGSKGNRLFEINSISFRNALR